MEGNVNNQSHGLEILSCFGISVGQLVKFSSLFFQEKEVQISKKGIASIIGTLGKLDEKAKHETFILQKNKLAKASTTQQDTNAQKKEDIDKLMKSTKSALEEVELPSSSTSPPQEQHSELKYFKNYNYFRRKISWN